MQTPFTNAHIIGSVRPADYCKAPNPRGHKEFVMSRGELMEFNRCPHRWLRGYQSDETKSTEWGTLMDCLVLTPGQFDKEFAVAPQTYENSKGEEKTWNWNANTCKEWRDEHQGLTIIKTDWLEQANQAKRVLAEDPQIVALLMCSKTQVMGVAEYHDKETGITVPVKILVDIAPEIGSSYQNSLADLKTCATASLRAWTRAVFDHGYHVQAAFYLDVWKAATGQDRVDFLHVLQESFPPYEVGKRLLSQEYIELGRLTYTAAMQRYCRCLADNDWPGYDSKAIFNGWNLVDVESWMITL